MCSNAPDGKHDTRSYPATQSDGRVVIIGYCIHCGMEWT